MIDKDYITKACDSLPMVEWDRCILMDTYNHAVVYGWIRSKFAGVTVRDFVVIQFWFEPLPDLPIVSFITSSAKWSAKINTILLPDQEHMGCQLVQDELPGLKRMEHR